MTRLSLLPDPDPLLAPRDVAGILRVTARTATTWARLGRIESVRLPSGHRRFRRSVVLALLDVPPPLPHPVPEQVSPEVAAVEALLWPDGEVTP